MRQLVLALSMTVTGAAQAASVTADMVACHDRETIYDLARTSLTSGSEIFMAKALRLSKDGQCKFLHEGADVTIEESHWMGAVCVRGGSESCLWIVKSVISGAD